MRKLFLYVANDLRVIAAVYLISLFLAAFLFHLIEGRTLAEGFWWACVTALTIGYGDLSPVTAIGRVMGVIFSHFWIFLIAPMIIGNIISKMLQDKEKFTHEEQEWQETALKTIASELGVKLPDSPSDYNNN